MSSLLDHIWYVLTPEGEDVLGTFGEEAPRGVLVKDILGRLPTSRARLLRGWLGLEWGSTVVERKLAELVNAGLVDIEVRG